MINSFKNPAIMRILRTTERHGAGWREQNFIPHDEIIVSQQCAAEQPEPWAWQFDDLIHGTGVCLTPGLLTFQFRPNDHRESPPITMWLLWLPFITSSMLI